MAKTKEQLINRALQEIGVLAAGQSPSSEDAKIVSDEIGPILSELATREIYTYGDPDVVEDAAFIHLAIILGNSVAQTFGMEPNDIKRLSAESRLRDVNFLHPTGAIQQAEYF